ncbi:Leucine-rich_repeat domain superfamily [Hexamita inflata]|uniref:Leucine-rich repeat domain superfamily n=1 Tax=Hexamita inflata TaxID=28002 RepID=A0AA86QGM6_9EUKA|nr:Leucine-rich repeat domain superfamily [Hexamita inflata]
MGVCYQDVNQHKPSEAKQSQNTNYYQNPSIIEYQVQQPIDQHKNENRYDQFMIKKYKNIISDNSLHLMKKKLKTIKFVENFDIKGLILDQCSDFHLQRVPTNIILLVIRDCKLNDVTGIKQMSQLQELDLSFNSIQNVNELSSLVKLVRLNLSHNILKSFPPPSGPKIIKIFVLQQKYYQQFVRDSKINEPDQAGFKIQQNIRYIRASKPKKPKNTIPIRKQDKQHIQPTRTYQFASIRPSQE